MFSSCLFEIINFYIDNVIIRENREKLCKTSTCFCLHVVLSLLVESGRLFKFFRTSETSIDIYSMTCKSQDQRIKCKKVLKDGMNFLNAVLIPKHAQLMQFMHFKSGNGGTLSFSTSFL